jgi:cellulose binding protein with CBM2 domain
MPYGFGLAFSSAVLVVAGLVSPSPSPSAPMTCPPVLPVSGAASAVTPTSVTISYSIFLSPPCGYDPPITVALFASQADAQQWTDPVGEAVSGPERSGQLTIGGLTPDTLYWFRFAAGDHRDPYVFASVRTAPIPVCSATIQIGSAWGGGFVATVSVRNVGTEAIDAWHVSWQWPGDERIQALWNATAQGAAAVGNASYNGELAPGASTTFGMLVATSMPPGAMALSCDRP